MDQYDSRCDGCKISQGLKEPKGKVLIQLDGGWTLNHYGGTGGFLGWLALQPSNHRMEFSDLLQREAVALGPNIQRIDLALRQYWGTFFKDDPIRRVYALYFHEGPFDKTPSPYHLHIHLIPRTQKMDALLRQSDGSQIIAWDIYKISATANCPSDYSVDDARAEHLAAYLKTLLPKPS